MFYLFVADSKQNTEDGTWKLTAKHFEHFFELKFKGDMKTALPWKNFGKDKFNYNGVEVWIYLSPPILGGKSARKEKQNTNNFFKNKK